MPSLPTNLKSHQYTTVRATYEAKEVQQHNVDLPPNSKITTIIQTRMQTTAQLLSALPPLNTHTSHVCTQFREPECQRQREETAPIRTRNINGTILPSPWRDDVLMCNSVHDWHLLAVIWQELELVRESEITSGTIAMNKVCLRVVPLESKNGMGRVALGALPSQPAKERRERAQAHISGGGQRYDSLLYNHLPEDERMCGLGKGGQGQPV